MEAVKAVACVRTNRRWDTTGYQSIGASRRCRSLDHVLVRISGPNETTNPAGRSLLSDGHVRGRARTAGNSSGLYIRGSKRFLDRYSDGRLRRCVWLSSELALDRSWPGKLYPLPPRSRQPVPNVIDRDGSRRWRHSSGPTHSSGVARAQWAQTRRVGRASQPRPDVCWCGRRHCVRCSNLRCLLVSNVHLGGRSDHRLCRRVLAPKSSG